MSPSAYDLARARARQAQGALNLEQAYAVRKSLLQFADRLTIQMGRGNASVATTRDIVLQQAKHLLDEIDKSIKTGRVVSFEQTLDIWKKSGREFAQAKGVTGAQLSQLSSPPITMMGAFESISPASTWRTLLSTNVVKAAQESTAIIREALTEGIGPDELARRLRRYVAGAEKFEKVFGDLNLRNIPEELQGAARQMTFNAERIAFSELHNARAEAEIQHFISDPFVAAVGWRLSPDRGTLGAPDECDYLAQSDFYGLGPGVYPVEAVPTPPHPFDRCERDPITRATSEIDKPKPSPSLLVDPLSKDAKFPRAGQLSPRGVERARASAAQAIANGRKAVAAAPVAPRPTAPPKPKAVRLLDPAPSTYLENTKSGFMRKEEGVVIWNKMDYDMKQLLARNSVSVKWASFEGLSRQSKELRELNALGFYDHAAKEVVVGIKEELSTFGIRSTLGHEVGHAVDFALGTSSKLGTASRVAWSNAPEGKLFVKALEADKKAAVDLYKSANILQTPTWKLLQDVEAGVAGAMEKAVAKQMIEYIDMMESSYTRFPGVTLDAADLARLHSKTFMPKQVLEVFADVFNGQRFGNNIRGRMYTPEEFKRMFPKAWKVIEGLKIPKVKLPAKPL